MGLSHEFDFYHNSELHLSCGEIKRLSCELKGLVLTVEPQILSRILVYMDVNVDVSKI